MDEVNSELAKELLKKKVLIDIEKEINFIYSKNGSIIEQYKQIESKVP